MILKASQRGHARALSLHLLNETDNDHAELHEIRGLASTNLHAALQEIDAASTGTRCKQPFFHLQLSPPENAHLTIAQFEHAVEAVEKKLGLVGHPRAVIFHEKNGRRHAHAVWSRLYEKEVVRTDRRTGEQVTDIKLVSRQMSNFKTRLGEVSLSLFLENGLEPPRGLVNKYMRDPNNYDLRIWQQATRLKEDPRDLKQIIRTALESAADRTGFEKSLKDHEVAIVSRTHRRR